MKRLFVLLLLVSLVFAATQTEAQISRKSQWEIFGGLAIPIAPDGFKDYFKVGGSLHGQYVMFPSPKFGIIFGVAFEGFTFDGDKFRDDLQDAEPLYDFTGVEVEGSATLGELAIGIRPYLSSPESNTQTFLLAMATYNNIKTEYTVSASFTDETITGEEKGSHFGVALGGGFEMPAGDRFNIIIQGLYRFVFVSASEEGGTGMITTEDEDETLSFVGVTLGLVF